MNNKYKELANYLLSGESDTSIKLIDFMDSIEKRKTVNHFYEFLSENSQDLE